MLWYRKNFEVDGFQFPEVWDRVAGCRMKSYMGTFLYAWALEYQPASTIKGEKSTNLSGSFPAQCFVPFCTSRF